MNGMSNIHHRNGLHGIDDEFNHGRPARCPSCWAKAKTAFFAPGRTPRRGVTLATTYVDIHNGAHGD